MMILRIVFNLLILGDNQGRNKLSLICNDGNLMRPYLVDHTENASGALVEQNKPASYKQIMSKDQAAFLQNLMAAVVSDGTGAKLSDQSYEAFG